MNFDFTKSTFQKIKDLFGFGKRLPPKASRPPIAVGRRGTGTSASLSVEETMGFVYEGQRIFVSSSNVMVMQFFYEEEKLVMEFLRRKQRSAAYMYSKVTVQDAIALVQAGSKGKACWALLRRTGKPFVRLH